jgi:hypothetical protein
VFLHRKFFADEKMSKGLFTFESNLSTSIYNAGLLRICQKKKKKKTSNCFFVDLARLFQNFKIKSETLEDKN